MAISSGARHLRSGRAWTNRGSEDLAGRTLTEPLAIPLFGPAHRASWMATSELAAELPIDLWAVVGGQMVVLHATQHGVALPSDRQTTDGDVIVDVRLSPKAT